MSIDPRLMERRKTVAEDKAKRNVGRLLKFLLVLLAAGAAVWLVFSPWLSVSQVSTSGIDVSDGHSVLVEEQVTAGTPMILLSASEVEEALLEDPWVAEADVRLAWPDQVSVEVVERFPVAWARTGQGWTRRAVDGVALPSETKPDDELAHIEMPGLGEDAATDSSEMLGALEFAAALPADLAAGTVVKVIDGELWATVSGFQVRLGRAVEMTAKARTLDALLDRGIVPGSAINLMAPTNPSTLTPKAAAEQTDAAGDSAEDDGEADVSAGDGETENP